jgi:glucose-fructose oxidoreductase
MESTPRPAPLTRRRFLGRLSAAAALAATPRWARAAGAPPRPLGVVLVGLGSYSTKELAPALERTDHCRLAGVVTGDPAKGRAWAQKYGFPEQNIFSYDTMGRMAGRPDIDVVYVVTPNSLHAQHCIAAAGAGKHVICEKPMATSVEDCDAIIAACKQAGVRLMVGYRLHYEPHHAYLARLAREQVFGPFTRMEGANGFQIWPEATPRTVWRLDRRLAGGGPLMDMGVYVIQAACLAKVEAPPVAVTASFGPVTMPKVFTEVEETVRWKMEFADGAVADCRTSYAEQVSRFRASSPQGWAELEDPAFYYDEPILKTSRGLVDLPKVNHQVAQLEGMALEILEHRPSLAPGEMGRRDIVITTAIYQAAKSGERRPGAVDLGRLIGLGLLAALGGGGAVAALASRSCHGLRSSFARVPLMWIGCLMTVKPCASGDGACSAAAVRSLASAPLAP